MATGKLPLSFIPTQLHICPQCNDDIASGHDLDGDPLLCAACTTMNSNLEKCRRKILPARRQPRLSGRRKL